MPAGVHRPVGAPPLVLQMLQLFLTTLVTTISARYPFPTPTQTVAGADHGRRGASYEAIEPIQVAAPADGSRAHKQCLPDRHSPATRHRPAPQRSQRVQRAVWLERVRVLFARSHIPAACLACTFHALPRATTEFILALSWREGARRKCRGWGSTRTGTATARSRAPSEPAHVVVAWLSCPRYAFVRASDRVNAF